MRPHIHGDLNTENNGSTDATQWPLTGFIHPLFTLYVVSEWAFNGMQSFTLGKTSKAHGKHLMNVGHQESKHPVMFNRRDVCS